jgi:hypothetical protein
METMSITPETTTTDRDRASARLLPLSKDPFPAPTDRDMLPSERRLFVQTHRTRCRPYATFVTPPRYLHSNDQQELTHWVSGSMPWDAPDAQAN